MLADRALLQSVCFAELAHRLAVFPRAQAEHQLLPHRLGQRLAAVEHLIAAQPHFLVVARPHARPFDRHLLAHHHAVAALAAPPAGCPFRLPPAPLADHFANFLLHQQIHQLQAGLTNQFTHPFTQPAHHLGHGQHHLHRGISVRGHFRQLLHCSLRFNLVWFLHSDSPFLGKRKFALSLARLGAGSRYFLRSTGHYHLEIKGFEFDPGVVVRTLAIIGHGSARLKDVPESFWEPSNEFDEHWRKTKEAISTVIKNLIEHG